MRKIIYPLLLSLAFTGHYIPAEEVPDQPKMVYAIDLDGDTIPDMLWVDENSDGEMQDNEVYFNKVFLERNLRPTPEPHDARPTGQPAFAGSQV